VVEHLPSMCKVLSSIPSTEKKKKEWNFVASIWDFFNLQIFNRIERILKRCLQECMANMVVGDKMWKHFCHKSKSACYHHSQLAITQCQQGSSALQCRQWIGKAVGSRPPPTYLHRHVASNNFFSSNTWLLLTSLEELFKATSQLPRNLSTTKWILFIVQD
jgi:hypothetical protein